MQTRVFKMNLGKDERKTKVVDMSKDTMIINYDNTAQMEQALNAMLHSTEEIHITYWNFVLLEIGIDKRRTPAHILNEISRKAEELCAH